jgi:hypothetical protein
MIHAPPPATPIKPPATPMKPPATRMKVTLVSSGATLFHFHTASGLDASRRRLAPAMTNTHETYKTG